MKSIINSESIIIDLSPLVFGFSPKGMVVIWFRYGYVSVQLGEFQAEVIKDDKKYADKMFSKFRRREIKPPVKERAVPKEMSFFWETGKGEAFEGRAFFSLEKVNQQFVKAGKDFKLDFKIALDNNSMQIMINNQPVEVDSTRIYKSEFKFKESYK